MSLLEDEENFHNKVETLQRELDEVDAWRDKMRDERPSGNLLIHLRNRLRGLRQLRARMAEVAAAAILLRERTPPGARAQLVADTAARLASQHDGLLQQLTQQETDLKRAINQKPPETVEDDFDALQKKIQAMETQIMSEHAMIAARDVMSGQLQRLRALLAQFSALQATYDRVVRERRDACEKGSVQELNFKSSVENLVTKFGDTRTILQQKINKLETGENSWLSCHYESTSECFCI